MSVSEMTCLSMYLQYSPVIISLLSLPHTAGKVCGYEVSWTSRPRLVPYMQTVPCVHPPQGDQDFPISSTSLTSTVSTVSTTLPGLVISSK